jgi:phospholipid N-methyltransferase
MPTLDWLKKEFHYGYDSGDILSLFPNRRRRDEEKAIGGSYRLVFKRAILPYINKDSKVLELGPGQGSWTRAILKHIPDGELFTIDFQDLNRFLKPENYNGRLKTFQIDSNDYCMLPDEYFDFFWSMGVLCHNNEDWIGEILKNSYKKMKRGGIAVHQYADWEKLEKYGWQKGRLPLEFKNKPDDEIWWPRNSKSQMVKLAERVNWKVITPDLDLLGRDSIIVLTKT